MRYITRPRIAFLVYLSLVIAFLAASTTAHGDTALAMMFLAFFFESICFPTIVALGIRGLGRHTKRGSGLIVGGVCGGAVVPPILGTAADAKGTALAMVVPVCFQIAAWTYAMAVNFVPSYRIPADALGESVIGMDRDQEREKDEESGALGHGMHHEGEAMGTNSDAEKK